MQKSYTNRQGEVHPNTGLHSFQKKLTLFSFYFDFQSAPAAVNNFSFKIKHESSLLL